MTEEIVAISDEWLEQARKVKEILKDCWRIILLRWTNLVFKRCGAENAKNEIVTVLDYVTMSFWRSSLERKGKIIFFPNIHIEIVPFLQSIRVVQLYETYTDQIKQVMNKYPLEYLYDYNEPEEKLDEEEEDEYIPDVKIVKQKNVKKMMKKKTTKKGLTSKIEAALKTGERKTKNRHTTTLSKRLLLSRSPSVRREEHIKFNLYSDVTPLFKKNESKERSTDGTEHRVDFTTEIYLGPVYLITSFESGKRAQKFGAWSIMLETDLEERQLVGESIQVSIKVPVEEVFLGSSEPIVAFRDLNSTEWKKNVFTTHTQFDQNIFIVSTRLSKMGYISLFQHNDFHFPYKKWGIHFSEENINIKLHTNVVELSILIVGNYFYLDTLTGDEFSKLRNLHQRKMTLAEMIIKLEKHGVHIIPNSEIIKKHRDTKKEEELEIFTYRRICLHQIDCESCRMNSTVSSETIVITIEGSPKNVITTSDGGYHANFGEVGRKREIHKDPLTSATLFQFLMATRPIVVTK